MRELDHRPRGAEADLPAEMALPAPGPVGELGGHAARDGLVLRGHGGRLCQPAHMPSIAITGATGVVGGGTAARLAARGVPTRLIVRDPSRAPALDERRGPRRLLLRRARGDDRRARGHPHAVPDPRTRVRRPRRAAPDGRRRRRRRGRRPTSSTSPTSTPASPRRSRLSAASTARPRTTSARPACRTRSCA